MRLHKEPHRFNRLFFDDLRESLLAKGSLSKEQIRKLSGHLFDLDVVAESLLYVLRREVIPACRKRDDPAILRALTLYDACLWQLSDSLLHDARRIITISTKRLSNKIESENVAPPTQKPVLRPKNQVRAKR